jgi:multidrug efflux pump
MAAAVATPLENQFSTIAGMSSMTSSNSLGATQITLEFDLARKLDGAAVDVQAAITQASRLLPPGMPTPPTFTKVNPADQPVLYLALTSPTRSPGQIYDAVSNVVQQKIAQVQGVGDVELGGGSLPAVRVDLLPFALSRYGVSSEDVRAALQAEGLS